MRFPLDDSSSVSLSFSGFNPVRLKRLSLCYCTSTNDAQCADECQLSSTGGHTRPFPYSQAVAGVFGNSVLWGMMAPLFKRRGGEEGGLLGLVYCARLCKSLKEDDGLSDCG